MCTCMSLYILCMALVEEDASSLDGGGGGGEGGGGGVSRAPPH